jgi:predicted nucleic acid-binding protein
LIVLDSSAAVDYLVGAADGLWVQQRLTEDPDIHAPHLLDIEVVGALRQRVNHGDLTVQRAEEALGDLLDLPVTRYPHLPFLERMWELRGNVNASDSVFVALAESLRADLVTTDRALGGAPGVTATIVTP